METQGKTIDNVRQWLREDAFPEPRRSEFIIEALATDRIGTDDKEVISEHIAPPSRSALEIRVKWRDGDGPGPTVYTHVNASVHQTVRG